MLPISRGPEQMLPWICLHLYPLHPSPSTSLSSSSSYVLLHSLLVLLLLFLLVFPFPVSAVDASYHVPSSFDERDVNVKPVLPLQYSGTTCISGTSRK